MFKFSKKRVLALAAVAALAVAGIAYAYWTTSGGGTGSATADSASASPVGITGGSTTALVPNSSATYTLTLDNPNSGGAYVGNVYATLSTDAAHSTCDLSAFKVDNAATAWSSADNMIVANVTVPAKTGTTDGQSTVSSKVWFNDDGSNQDACKNAPIAIAYSTTAP
jgi:hypothetical protein